MKLNYERFINEISAARVSNPLRELASIYQDGGPDMISFGAGMPNQSQFPFTTVRSTLRDGSEIIISGDNATKTLQYSSVNGLMSDYLKCFQTKFHDLKLPWKAESPNETELDIVVTNGAQNGLYSAFQMVFSPGDMLLMEEPAYPGFVAIARPFQPRILRIDTDSDGMVPQSLRSVLSKWSPDDVKNKNCVLPKLIYIQPNFSNPLGTTIPLGRRKEIYEIACEYNLLILEDDPYYFLSFSENRIPSFLSLDTEGRVLRIDSFSKIMSSGLRVGFMTGPKELIERIVLEMQVSSIHCSGASQMLVLSVLEQWGLDGFYSHTRTVAAFYKSQCDRMVKAIDENLQGLVEYEKPQGGMFIWLKAMNLDDVYDLIMTKAITEKVVIAPGTFFFSEMNAKSPYMRLTFSMANEDQMKEGLCRLSNLLKGAESVESSNLRVK